MRLCARDEDFLEEEGPDDETAGQSPGTSASSTLILVSSQCNWARASADDLSKKDIEALNAELSDPRFADSWWQDQINMMLELGKKAEQQSLAKYGLDFVTETYLPEKLAELGLA